MIEIFKTNVKTKDQAKMLIGQIHKSFPDYKANFDLEDCDRILRVKYEKGPIHPILLIDLLKDFGFHTEVLADNFQPLYQG